MTARSLRLQQLVNKGYVSEQPQEFQDAYHKYVSFARRLLSRGKLPGAIALQDVAIDFILGEQEIGVQRSSKPLPQ